MAACRKAQLEGHPGLKKDDSSYLTDLRLYHNHVRLHLGLSDGQTPGEAAGIKIEGANKRKAMIQAAAKAATRSPSIFAPLGRRFCQVTDS